MLRFLEREGMKFAYTLRVSSRARHVRLSIQRDGQVLLTLPRHVPEHMGQSFLLQKSDWVLRKMAIWKRRPAQMRLKGTRQEFVAQKTEALTFVQERIQVINAVYGFTFARVTVKNMKTRWGSCSRQKNMNFHYKIAVLPRPLADYIITHELCHLTELNHGPRFWRLVAQTMPDYRLRKRALRGFALA